MTDSDQAEEAGRPGRARARKRKWLAVAMVLAGGNAALGLIMSFSNIGQAAAAHDWHPWWTLAVMIDLGVPTYIIADHWLVAHGHRSILARFGTWSCAAYTIILNAAVSTDPDLLWKATHMIAPSQWVLGVEAVRHMWKAWRRGDQPPPYTAGASRWLAAPIQTPRLWRRRHVLGVSWPAMFALEEAALFVRDLVAANATDEVPLTIKRAVDERRFPAIYAAVITTKPPEVWQPILTEWVASLITLADTLRAAVSALTPVRVQAPIPAGGLNSAPLGDLAPGLTPGQTPALERARDAGSDSRSGPGSDPVRPATTGRTMTAQQLAELAREELGMPPVPSINQIMNLAQEKGAGVGKPKAREAHSILEAERMRAIG